MIQGCKHGGHNDSDPIEGMILWGHHVPVYSPDGPALLRVRRHYNPRRKGIYRQSLVKTTP